MEASLVVITRNQANHLRELIPTIAAQQSSSKFETIIVNDCSTDDTQVLLDSLPQKEDLVIIHCGQNIGRAAARNLGADKASGKVLIFIDGDLILSERFVQGHINFHRSEFAAAVGRTLYRGDSGVNRYFESRGGAKVGEAGTLPFRYFISMNFSIPQSLFDKLNGFDTEFSSYGGEDLDLGCRIHKNGTSICYLPSALATHIEESSLTEIFGKRYQFGLHGLPLFVKKHPDLAQDIPVYRLYSSNTYRYLSICLLNPIFARIIKNLVLKINKLPAVFYDYMIVKAIFDGLNDANEKNVSTSGASGPERRAMMISLTWLLLINILYLFGFAGERYKTALKVLEDIFH